MLDRLRGCFPSLRSLLMDRETLLRHEALWVEEANPYKGPLVRLTEEEHRVYQMLMGMRLEQERIPYGWVWRALSQE